MMRAEADWILEFDTEPIPELWKKEAYPRVPENLEQKIALKERPKPPDDRLEYESSTM